MVALKCGNELGGSEAAGDRKGPDEVADAAVARGDEIGQRQIGPAVWHLFLLAEHVEAEHFMIT